MFLGVCVKSCHFGSVSLFRRKSTKVMALLEMVLVIIGAGIVLVVYIFVELLKWLSSLCSPTRQKGKQRHVPQAVDECYLVYENDNERCYYNPVENRYYRYPKGSLEKSVEWQHINLIPDITPTMGSSYRDVPDDVRFSSPDELFYEPDYNDTRYDDMMEGEDKDW